MANLDLVSQGQSLFSGFNLGGIWTYLSYGILIAVVIGVVAVFFSQFLLKKRFNKTITFWKRNSYSGALVADRTIKAMTVRLDNWGNLGYRLQTPYETKNLIPRLKIEAKPNNHYVEYCSDGRIVEFAGIGDYDDQRKIMNARFTDDNTELGRSSTHQINKERYEKTNFWKEHAVLLVNIGAICIIMVFLWFIAKELVSFLGGMQGLLKQMGTLQDAQSNILDSLNRLLTSNHLTTVNVTG